LKEKHLLQRVLNDLAEAKKIEASAKHYSGISNLLYLEGTVDYVNPNFAFIVVGEPHADVRVPANKLRLALHGDKVRIIARESFKTGRLEGEVMEVLERAKTSFVGTIEITPRYAFVVPSDRKMHFDIFIPLRDIGPAKHRQKVVVELTEWNLRDKNPTGRVVKVLGNPGEHDTEIHAIMFEYGLPFSFPKEVDYEAKYLKEGITPEEVAKRRDFRGVPTFTIDPLTAKDFDDALSIQRTARGTWEIGVHIADVTHYVQPDTILDKEGAKRATSVYLVDRTVPMLPERLSNELCSLRPNEDKLTFSAVFELNDQAEILEEWFGRTVIHSQRRFTYEEAQEIIEGAEGDFKSEILELNRLAKILKDRRFAEGAISFESVEFVFKLAEDGKTPLGMFPKTRKDAHKLIEEFMLLANKRVATFIYKMNERQPNTMVYRVHESPDPEKIMELVLFLKRFGYTIDINPKKLSASLNQLTKEIEGKPEQNVIETQAIRSMAKAKYTTDPLGHYGLGFEHYTHFTSPIRRYPDMLAHRLLQHYLDQGKSARRAPLEDLCKHSSNMEKRASEAERASIKYKQMEYMQQFEGMEMDGFVSGVTEWGMYVELKETRCEGMVRLAGIEGDYYQYDNDRHRIVGLNFGRVFNIGDPVRVVIKRASPEKREMDLGLAIEE
jgi:ribonuclease R